MKEITAVTEQKKGDRLNVFLDGQFAFSVAYETAVKFGLKKGETLSDEDERRIAEFEGETAAFARGLKYAVKKTVSERQMRDYLLRLGFGVGPCEAALVKLAEYGYIDDEKFASAYIATYGGSLGKKRLKLGLKNAGVCDDIVADALEKLDDGRACRDCAEKYLRTHKAADRNKMTAYLAYRGFEFDEINEVVGELEERQ